MFLTDMSKLIESMNKILNLNFIEEHFNNIKYHNLIEYNLRDKKNIKYFMNIDFCIIQDRLLINNFENRNFSKD
jgi:hypothetical protein